jgi:hypothetical protein
MNKGGKNQRWIRKLVVRIGLMAETIRESIIVILLLIPIIYFLWENFVIQIPPLILQLVFALAIVFLGFIGMGAYFLRLYWLQWDEKICNKVSVDFQKEKQL